MTTASPDAVWYTFEARRGSQHLPVTNISATMDRDRQSLCTATLTLDWIDDALLADLDPRTGATVLWFVQQWTGDPDSPTEVGRLPNIHELSTPTPANMFVRSVTRHHVDRTVTVVLAGGESYLADKKRNVGGAIDTGAATVYDLVLWSLIDVFGGLSIAADAPAFTAIPAGDRRKMLPKESHQDLIQPEMDAVSCRLLDYWGWQWSIKLRSTVSGTLKLATVEGIADTDPIVYEVDETLSRDGDWADGVLIEYDQPDGTKAYQSYSTVPGIPGANTRSLVLTRERAAPASNAAEGVVARSVTRGYDLEVTARCRFDLDIFMDLEIHTPDTVLQGRIRAVEWDIGTSEMRIRAQYGEPEE